MRKGEGVPGGGGLYLVRDWPAWKPQAGRQQTEEQYGSGKGEAKLGEEVTHGAKDYQG